MFDFNDNYIFNVSLYYFQVNFFFMVYNLLFAQSYMIKYSYHIQIILYEIRCYENTHIYQ